MLRSLMHRVKSREMTPKQMRKARRKLGLNHREFAVVLKSHITSVHNWQSDNKNRNAPASISELVRAYLSGYRSDDWPGGK